MKIKPKHLCFLVSDIIALTFSFAIACFLSRVSINLFRGQILIPKMVIISLQLLVFLKFGFYRAVLRYASVDFLITVVKGVSLSSAILMIGFYVADIRLPIQVFLTDWIITIGLVGGSRFVVRYYFEFRQRYREGIRALIYGAGDLGVMALRQLKQDSALSYVPVGFIDDDPSKTRNKIHNLSVLGTWNNLDKLLIETRATEIVVAIAEIAGEKLRKVVRDCRERNIMCRLVPSFPRMLAMEPMVRNIEISDLLKRSPRDLDKKVVDEFIEGKKILITGAAGSIGSELVRQCLKHNPDEIIAADQSEYGIYNLQEEFSHEDRIKYVLVDITNDTGVKRLYESFHPNIVFHAAAYKHVPILEENVEQAVINNIQGTKILATLADRYGVEKFVMISTDKAVKPSSVMGATKRVCELFIQNFSKENGTEYVAVRFGNVLGSSGSVIPKFISQIREGGPVTITHPEATRYFMLTSEAVQLVLQAAAIGEDGKIFILDMGSPVKIAEMAEDLIYLMGRKPHADVEIKYTGLRPGEKIYEELFTEEIESRTRYENITVAKARKLEWSSFNEQLDKLISYAKSGDAESANKYLNLIVAGVDNTGINQNYNKSIITQSITIEPL